MVGEFTSMPAIIRGGTGAADSQLAVMVLANPYGYGNLPPSFQSEIDFFRFPILDPAILVAEVVEPFG